MKSFNGYAKEYFQKGKHFLDENFQNTIIRPNKLSKNNIDYEKKISPKKEKEILNFENNNLYNKSKINVNKIKEGQLNKNANEIKSCYEDHSLTNFSISEESIELSNPVDLSLKSFDLKPLNMNEPIVKKEANFYNQNQNQNQNQNHEENKYLNDESVNPIIIPLEDINMAIGNENNKNSLNIQNIVPKKLNQNEKITYEQEDDIVLSENPQIKISKKPILVQNCNYYSQQGYKKKKRNKYIFIYLNL